MPLTTEFFVMCIFIAGWPFIFIILRDADLPGRKFFMIAYVSLTFSNIFTVVEELWLETFFNLMEHLLILAAAIMILIAVIQLTSRNHSVDGPSTSGARGIKP